MPPSNKKHGTFDRVYQSKRFLRMIVFRGFRSNINPFTLKKILFLLALFLLVFPKGGFKIGPIPITWGYSLIGIACIMVCSLGSWSISLSRLSALFCLIPFQAIVFSSMIWHGIEAGSTGWAISFFISFFFFPYVFLLLFSEKIEKMDLDYFLNLVKKRNHLCLLLRDFFIYLQTNHWKIFRDSFFGSQCGRSWDSGRIKMQ